MKYLVSLVSLFFIFVSLSATIINVPADQPTIQAGIDAAVDADTVLVQPGTYVENINYNGKNITVASLFLTTQDTTYISQTVIDGNQSGSVVTFESAEDSTAVLCGFNIENGNALNGGGIYCISASNPIIENSVIFNNFASGDGAGLFCHSSEIILRNLAIINNAVTYHGGGIYFCYSDVSLQNIILTGNTAQIDGGGIYYLDTNIELKNVSIYSNSAIQNGGGMYLNALSNDIITSFDSQNRCSIYSNNSGSGVGNDIYLESGNTAYVVVDTFSVFYSSDYYTYPRYNFSFDIQNCAQVDLIDADVYVSPLGDDANSGLNADEPFKTIQHALSRIDVDEQNPHTIHLLQGTYSPQNNGESYPIYLMNHINIEGNSQDDTILDAEDTDIIFRAHYVSDAIISNLKAKNGFSHLDSYGMQGHGGGIYCYHSDMTLQNLIVAYNYAVFYGGGIYCCYSDPIMNNITISHNECWEDGKGGGLYCYYSNPTLENVEIAYNICPEGGGVYCEHSDPIMNDVTIQINDAANDGGGIYCDNSNPTMDNVVIHGNDAASNGGGIYCVYSDPILESVIIEDNTASSGGGIYCHTSNPHLENVNIENNITSRGGGIYCRDSNPYLENVTIDENYSSTYGSGIFSDNSIIQIQDSDICENQTSTGGGIYCEDSEIMVENTTIHFNTSHNPGGGINCDNSTININNSIINSNESYYEVGGGLYCNNSEINIFNTHVTNNSSELSGAGIALESTNAIFEDMTIYGNWSMSGDCAGICCYDESNLDLFNCILQNNCAENGGAIACRESSEINLINSLLSGNLANDYGAACYVEDSAITNINTTITENGPNNPGCVGGAFYCNDDAELTVINSIFFNNQPEEIHFSPDLNSSSVNISYSNIQGGEAAIVTNNNGTINWLDGNIDLEPDFVSSGDHPFSLSGFSPCIETGIPDTTGLNLPEYDLAGNPRIHNDIIDMGAYEFQDVPFAADFASDITSGLNPLEIQFTDLSTVNPLYWGWDFDNDGILDSNEQNPNFTYTQAGIYSVSLTISDGINSDTEIKENYITVGGEVIADFEADVTSGLTPLEVHFTDLSVGGLPASEKIQKSKTKKRSQADNSREITSWQWDFDNDGTIDSNEQNPTFTYEEAGVYSVSLTVSDGTYSDTELKTDYINVSEVGTDDLIITKTQLLGNYPNPFNPSTTISFSVTQSSDFATIEIYNLKGQKVKTLDCGNSFAAASGNCRTHSKTVYWDGTNQTNNPVSSGIYYYKLVVDGKTVDTKKCMLLK
ncbi:MAG TPA: PKD domain-containing protein [Candidatus Cloacimonadota bacterium]|nr:PKD domain-containing protein [Candidatus Cloacimonadota bacterium]